MRTQRMPWAVPLLLAWLMLGMSLSMFVLSPNSDLSDSQTPRDVGLDEPTPISIQIADGSSSALKAEVPVGHTVESIDLSLSPDALAYNDGFSWSGESDWNASGALLDKVNVNVSEGMQLLPQEWVWDFENSNHGWVWHHPVVGLGGMIHHSGSPAAYMVGPRPSTPTMGIIPITCLGPTGRPVQSSIVPDAVGPGTCSIGSDWVLNIITTIMPTSKSRMRRAAGSKSIRVPAPSTMVHSNW